MWWRSKALCYVQLLSASRACTYISVICQLANSVVNVIPLRLVDKAVSVSNNRAHLATQVKIYCWLTVKDLFIILAGILWNV